MHSALRSPLRTCRPLLLCNFIVSNGSVQSASPSIQSTLILLVDISFHSFERILTRLHFYFCYYDSPGSSRDEATEIIVHCGIHQRSSVPYIYWAAVQYSHNSRPGYFIEVDRPIPNCWF
ncbi:hypothetical protein BDZ94DRAFT_1272870 [Collybia nuda]|uniref:Uncharacterized protein n=1 Tax=Collybia nuda TaxID=64659 RepID=A0A9P6CCX2_9AGAR|nr:hypothetical protein BDZ94DRAFT_1272870 [Collybia nuda]